LFDSNSDLNGFKYGVIGFKYSGEWDTYKLGSPEPNVFEGNSKGVEEVECDEAGYGTYSPLQGWSNALNYTFFAYYPMEGVTLFSVKDEDYVPYTGGSPYIYYALNTTTDAELKNSMVDLMTATNANEDLTYSHASVSDGNVSFSFGHRLSSVGVSVRNSTSGTITLTGITLTVSGIENESIIIPLDGGDVETSSLSNSDTYSPSLSLDVPTDAFLKSSTADELDDKLIFIPQESGLSIDLTVNYIRTVEGYVSETFSNTINDVAIASLDEGYKYIIPLNFSETTVEVTGTITGGNWGTTHTVNGSFN
jgi:hypothetical protein